jgi:acyl-CoA synthetase (AMP-forming)/AMP-acid ligase II
MIFTSPYPDVDIPELALPDFVLEHAADRGAKPALVDGPSGRSLTHADAAPTIGRVAGALAERGVGHGDVVALLAPNAPEYAVAFHAVAALGAVCTTVNPIYTVDEVAHQLRHAGVRVLISGPQVSEGARAAADLAGVSERYVFGEDARDGAQPFAALLDGDPAAAPVGAAEPDDLVALPYSSGTTGLPKGVMLTHRNLVANILQSSAQQPVTEDDTVIAVLPFFHIYGLTVVMNAVLRNGATAITMPRFDLEGFLALIERHHATKIHVVPPIVLALAKSPLVERYDLSSLQLVNSGAAPLSAELAEAAAARVGCPVVQGYGMTESSPVTHATPIDPARHRPGSIGPPVPNTECRIVALAGGAALGAGEEGEVCVRGPQVMRGYLDDPEATARTIDADGWLHTGDVGRADEDGYVVLVDRVKELIKYKGYQVAPAELEALLVEHPAVAEAAVIGHPDEEAGEVPTAFVALGAEASAEEIIAFVAERVAPYKKLRGLEIVDEIPKSASGKILRRVLAERAKTPG